MNTAIRIFVDENEFDFANPSTTPGEGFSLNAETSVSKLKAHYFETLGRLGEIVRFKRDEARPGSSIARALTGADSLVATFHELPPELPCRLLQHTKGALMLPGGFLGPWTFDHAATVSIVTSALQASRITRSFPGLPLRLFPFYPMIGREFLDTEAAGDTEETDRRRPGHVLYAGRWIANKGLVQTVRALRLWDSGVSSFEAVGQFERDFPISQCGGGHFNYPSFHQREFLDRHPRLELIQTPSLPAGMLAASCRRAAAFAYLSFHEDENYGMAPREAAACGAIPMVTDWCGLGEFGRKAVGGLVRTWPTLGGIRYSLKEASGEMARVMSWTGAERERAAAFNRECVASECSGRDSARQMADAVAALLELPAAPPPEGGWRFPSRLERLIAHGPPAFRNARREMAASEREGLHVEGLGLGGGDHSEADLLTAIQALYTTWPAAPVPRPGVRLHGFWRVAPWEQERALVEFGFPGPRVLRFSESEWRTLAAAAIPLGAGDFAFEIRDAVAAEVFQRAVEFGYLVPDDPMQCDLPEPLDPLPQRELLATGSD
jgi:hypothetical protein